MNLHNNPNNTAQHTTYNIQNCQNVIIVTAPKDEANTLPPASPPEAPPPPNAQKANWLSLLQLGTSLINILLKLREWWETHGSWF